MKIKLKALDKKIISNGINVYGKLPKAFKNKWLKALRSGKYVQGKSALRYVVANKPTYCCLGVACHVAGASGITNKSLIENTTGSIIKSINKVPKLLQGAIGIPNILANMNDCGMSFNDIADFIEEYL